MGKATPPRGKKRATPAVVPRPPPRRRVYRWVVGAALLLVAAAAWLLDRPVPDGKQQGPPDDCLGAPVFALRGGLTPPLMIDLRPQTGHPGFSLVESRPGGRALHLPQWDVAGTLGWFALDRAGNIFVAPIPFFRSGPRPAAISNQFYIVESRTGQLREFARLPCSAPPSGSNPFGVTGLAFDCGTSSLYVASIAGSGPRAESGRLFQLDPATGAVRSEYRGVDALAVQVWAEGRTRRLYFGSARKSEVRSIALDPAGGFRGDPRVEVTLAGQPGGAFDKALGLRFLPEGGMEVKGLEFSFSLIAASDPQRNLYTFTRHATEDRWEFRDVLPQR